MKADKKPGGGLLAVFSGKPKPEDDSEDMDDGGGMESAKMTAAEDAMAAFKSGDSAGLSDALQRHYEACAASGNGADEEY